ncbi:DNA polymerase III subunit gamma/tau [Microbacterium sp. 5K110]|uniref:DNA polymerase III subunit gamma/tau n=1 Tax=unclassified Microbacterium TaxID=2609290 RepID=UPI0010FCF1A1|nr:DNA polymerase III subunit gamma/tau [Microbacterium sp. 5K110]TLF27829.1 DNA polymerase III subunit gamma/tau [Microbacterium sp. 5K110]
MSTPRDDDALSWDGDDDPTLDVGDRAPADNPGTPAGAEPAAAASTHGAPTAAPTEQAPTDPAVRQPAASSAPDPAPTMARAQAPAQEETETAPAASTPLGNAGLVGIGMVAATFLLFAIGWVLAGRQLLALGIPIPDVTVIALTAGAALAPPTWFVATLVLTRGWRTWQRFLVLILGVVLLVPWPLLSMGSLV